MIDWAGRIDELAEALRRQHAINDRLALEALLSAMIDCPRAPTSWLILETNWHSRDCENGWFSFGKLWQPASLKRLRARYPWREIEAEMKEWIENPAEAHLFIEPEYETYPVFCRLTQAQFLLQSSLRIRAPAPRTASPLRELDPHDANRRQAELATYAKAVIEDRVGARPQTPPRFIEPPEFLYYFELVQKLAPWYSDWRMLVRAFAALAMRHAHLHGRAETGPADNALLARVASDSVPPWIAHALRLLLENHAHTKVLIKAMRLPGGGTRAGSRYSVRSELTRLERAGIIEWDRHETHWKLSSGHRAGVRALLEGRAFSALASAA